MDWKQLVVDLDKGVREDVRAVQTLHEPESDTPQDHWGVPITADEDLLVFEGRGVKRREVRGWLWEQRKKRSTTRPGSFVWAAYDEEEKQTLVGLGAWVSQDVRERLTQMREMTHGH